MLHSKITEIRGLDIELNITQYSSVIQTLTFCEVWLVNQGHVSGRYFPRESYKWIINLSSQSLLENIDLTRSFQYVANSVDIFPERLAFRLIFRNMASGGYLLHP